MSEIEKMYENARIKKQYCGWLNMGDLDTNVQYVRCATKEEYDNYAALDSSDLVQIIPDEVYPPFTAEKQLQLENFLLEDSEDKTFTQFEMLKTIENKFLYVYRFSKNNSSLKRFDTIGETRQECLAGLINSLWQSLTEEEKQQVKGILE